ncbi:MULTISPECIES: DMT family transporter [unclassified Limnohabitans]|jgi:drug/metabolite transporter (DMT)-like permease|uniref:DMT family transporter n=1 Tax=unclassified Limnohabitans TaxID=2626134 RepID=UPI000B3029DE|nr:MULTISPECIES: DMT family transporter [unclassified Limnohabitans]OYU11582.1 MAG: permease [Comamonadaceae bacterium PBBC1]PUE15473.1 permease [Limnohabitans sp. WS1]
MRMSHSLAVWTMVGCTALWSIAGVVTRHLEEARSFEVTFWRSFFTVVSLLIILPVWQGWGVWARVPWRNRYFWLSGLCWSVMFTAFMVALTLTAVANVLITMAAGPLLTALFTRVFLRHQLPLRTWVAIVLAGVGIGWMYGSQLSLGDPNFLIGSLVALCVPIAGAVQWTLAQKSQNEGHSLDLVPSVLLGALFSTLLTLPLAMPFQASVHDVSLLAMLGLFQLAIPCVVSVVCVRVLKAPEASLLCLLEIVFGIALAWWGANEAPQMSVLLGGSLVLGALLMNQWLGWRQNNV